jgi:hypothetical protein
MKAVRFIAVVSAAASLSACATMVRGTEQQVSVNTDPVGAKIRFSNGQECIGPCTIKAKRNQSLQLTITKEGCATLTATMVPTLGGAGVILGGLIDYGTGAVYDLEPNPLSVSMVCGTMPQAVAAQTSAPAAPTATPATAAPQTPNQAPPPLAASLSESSPK